MKYKKKRKSQKDDNELKDFHANMLTMMMTIHNADVYTMMILMMTMQMMMMTMPRMMTTMRIVFMAEVQEP